MSRRPQVAFITFRHGVDRERGGMAAAPCAALSNASRARGGLDMVGRADAALLLQSQTPPHQPSPLGEVSACEPLAV